MKHKLLLNIVIALSLYGTTLLTAGANELTLVDGTRIPGEIVPADHAGLVILRSPRSGLAQSFRRDMVHTLVQNGQMQTLNPRRALTPEETEHRSPVIWGDAPGTVTPPPDYSTQAWEPARLLVWAKPGESGCSKKAENWLENGRPASAPPDRDTDILLPQADTQYVVGPGIDVPERRNEREEYRHITVENNAAIAAAWHPFSGYLRFTGHVWIKRGGRFAGGQMASGIGSAHSVFRVDHGVFPSHDNDHKLAGGHGTGTKLLFEQTTSSINIGRKFTTAKSDGASIEIIGNIVTEDETFVSQGRLIVGEDSQMRWAAFSHVGVFEIRPQADVIMRSGSALGAYPIPHRVIKRAGESEEGFGLSGGDIRIAGTLRVGTPEHPITRDVHFYCQWHQKLSDDDPSDKARAPTIANIDSEVTERSKQATGTGLGVHTYPTARMEVHSANPAQARLIVTSNSLISSPGHGAPSDLAAEGSKRGISMLWMGDIHLNATQFDYVRQGGIMVTPEVRLSWKNISYGPHNAGPAETLWGALPAWIVERTSVPEKRKPMVPTR